MYSRTTTSGMYNTLLGSLQDSLAHVQDLQRQLATNNKYAKLSDNPAAVTRGLELQSTISATEKYMQNGQNAISMLKYSEGAMQSVLSAAQDIRDLVIQAGDGALSQSELKDIVDQIEAKKQNIMDALNTKIAGQYIFGGTDTSTPPFSMTSDGSIVYNGSDERIKYALDDGITGDVSFAGNEVVPTNESTYFICSHKVPLDWEWTGREEKVQITVGNRTIAVFIPEEWWDELTNEREYTDYNGFRDPGELSGFKLDDLATLVNRSLQEQGADMIVTATVEKNFETGEQQMFIKSNTGEKVGITGWTDTDYMPVCAELMSNSFKNTDGTVKDLPDWQDANSAEKYNGIMGKASALSWKGGTGDLTVNLDGSDYTFALSDMSSISDLIEKINATVPADAGDLPVVCTVSGNLVLQSTRGQITVSGDADDLKALFGTDGAATEVKSSNSSLTVTVGGDTANATKIYINDGDKLEDIADKLHSIEGVYARSWADKAGLTVVAQRVGEMYSDRLNVDEAKEALHYPSLQIEGKGAALELFDFNIATDPDTGVQTGSLKAEHSTRAVDHSHMDVFDVLGMETAMKSVEFGIDQTLKVKDGEPLHWRVMSGGHTTDIKINPGDYTMEELATRLKNAGAGWLEVTVDVVNPNGINSDATEDTPSSFNQENATQRLVIRGYNGEQVLFLDMNEQHYADELGLSTALRTDAYTEDKPGTGTKCVVFPSAPCIDDNLGVKMRVQMNCGMTYDVNIVKKDVVNPKTGFVDREKVMRQIVDQVNAQEGENIMGISVPVDANGKELGDRASIYFLSGESFTVVDLPFSDPVWSDYSGGIAAQMGIHGGVSANMGADKIFKDNSTMLSGIQDAIDDNKIVPVTSSMGTLNGVSGTIRFSNLSHEVEIDVSSEDTVKDIMDRLRTQAGDWLYVNYYDTHMGQTPARNTGDYPILAISSKDGSAVSVTDVKGSMT
ncbi:MAG: flagellar hook-associated protein FlgL, partial [Synergistaceae bacterium]|nr:flagellar hook-associated protein FlgL [Synergistaceae bacterium]